MALSDVDKILEESNKGWDFFEKHIPNLVKEKKAFKNREDENTPSAFVTLKGGRYIFKDFGGTEKAMDMFEFAKEIYNLPSHKDFPLVLSKISDELNINLDKKEKPISYIRPVYKTAYEKKYDEMIGYFEGRRISKKTVSDFGLFVTKVRNQSCIVFPYTKDGELVNQKTRIPYKDKNGVINKTYLQDSNAEPVLFGLDQAAGKKTWVIVEGETDTLSGYEVLSRIDEFVDSYKANFRKDLPEWMWDVGIVSPPGGANDPLHCITNTIQWIDQVDTFIIFSDDDKVGEVLRSSLSKRLPTAKVKLVKAYHKCKDANQILCERGATYVLNSIATAEHLPIKDIVSPIECWDDMIAFVEGTKTFTQKLGWSLDKVWRPCKSLTCFTGTPESGKSALAANVGAKCAVELNIKVLLYSPEEPNLLKLARNTATLSGVPYIKGSRYYNEKYERAIFEQYKAFIDEMFHWYCPKDNTNIEELEATIREAVYRLGIGMVIIDPFTHIESMGESRHETVRIVMSRLNKLKHELGIEIIIVAHPKKVPHKIIEGAVVVQPITIYDIAESSNFGNACDFILSLYRDPMKECTDIRSEKMKFNGIEGMEKTIVSVQFDVATNRFYGLGVNNKEFLYPIEKATWGVSMEEPKGVDLPKEQLDSWAQRKFNDYYYEREDVLNDRGKGTVTDEDVPF